MDNKIRVALSKDLRKKYGIRSFPIATGDIVTIRTGSRKGEGGKVISVDHRTRRVSIDGITVSKADAKQEEYLLPSNIMKITRLELSSPGRLQKIRDLAARKNIVVEEPEPEPEPEVPEETVEETSEEDEGETSEDAHETEEDEGESEEVEEEPAEEPEEEAEEESEEEVEEEEEE